MSIDLLERTAEITSASGTIKVSRSTPVIGAEITGIDLREELDDATVAKLRRKLLKHKVLFFRDQPISDADQIRFSRYFGKVTPAHPVTNGLSETPEIMQNVKSAQRARKSTLNEAQQIHLRAFGRSRQTRGWHTDITFVANPTSITFLRGVEIPETGGDTLWVNLEALYDSLSPAIQQLVDGLTAVHGRDDARAGFAPPPRFDQRTAGPFLAEHPLVRVHPETGERALYSSPSFLKRIVGLSPRESEQLLALLFEHSIRPEYTVRFKWEAGSVAFWDNRSTAHLAPVDIFDTDFDRQLYRITLVGDVPIGPDGRSSVAIEGEPVVAHSVE